MAGRGNTGSPRAPGDRVGRPTPTALGAYRDNEVGPSHPLTRRLKPIRATHAALHEIVLGPLGFDDTARLVADTLHCTPEKAWSLAKLVQEKTAGNPFFVIQFLTVLAEEGLIAFDAFAGWTWDLGRIHATGYTDNVVDLMIAKLRRLPARTQDALAHLACLGNSASTARLGAVLEGSEEEVHARLWDAVHAGLIVRSGRAYAFLVRATLLLVAPLPFAKARLVSTEQRVCPVRIHRFGTRAPVIIRIVLEGLAV
jgi:predicted ATPase